MIAATSINADCLGIDDGATCLQGCEVFGSWVSGTSGQTVSHNVAWNECGLWADPTKSPSAASIQGVTITYKNLGIPNCGGFPAPIMEEGVAAGTVTGTMNDRWPTVCIDNGGGGGL